MSGDFMAQPQVMASIPKPGDFMNQFRERSTMMRSQREQMLSSMVKSQRAR